MSNSYKYAPTAIIGKVPVYARASYLAGKVPTQNDPIIGDGTYIGDYCIIYCGTTIGMNSYIADYTGTREHTRIGSNTIIGRGCILEARCSIGNNCKIQAQCHLGADLTVEDDCFFGPGVVTMNDKEYTSGNVRGPIVRKGAKVGSNATILPGVVIGEGARIGAGAVVTKDVPPGETWVGNPARRLMKVPPLYNPDTYSQDGHELKRE
jgi:UDP-2-acetamido-3-amino-2,3-dideoxy-glucuronate N-acetyltransferase